MAMSRIISQSAALPFLRPSSSSSAALIRHRSSKSNRAQLIELDLDPTSSNSNQSDSPEVITVGMKKLEDAIHGIIVRRAAPDWLPFLPGYSYWVPPRSAALRNHHPSAGTMLEVIGKLAAATTPRTYGGAGGGGPPHDYYPSISDDEEKSCTSSKGWPSSAFFIEGTSPIHPVPVVEVEVKIHDIDENADDTSNSEKEEG